MSSQKRQKRRKAKNLCQLEPLFQGVKEALTHDLGGQFLASKVRKMERGQDVPLNYAGCTPYIFKKISQLRDFDKRVIWSTDRSFDELSKESFRGFVESQQSFLLPEPMSLRATRALTGARHIVSDILGYFDVDEWLSSCSFGVRAAVGLPRRECYLDTRFDRISGTHEQQQWFNEALSRDVHLLRAVRKRARVRKSRGVVKATSVPKAFKSARITA
mgnify:CR=1 FL=1